MTVAHIGVGLFCIGVTVVQSYRIEKDFALKPGQSVELQGYTFAFDSLESVAGPNYDAVQSHFTVTRDGKLVAKLNPQKRIYRVRTMPMTEAGIEVDWNRDLFVAMGDDLGEGAWSLRLQYKPMVRFIWFGALVMAIGGFIAITDRRYRTRKSEADERLGKRQHGHRALIDLEIRHAQVHHSACTVRPARRVPVRGPAARPVATCRRR